MKKLIALALIGAAISGLAADIAQGLAFEADDALAEKLIADGLAELAPAADPVPPPKVTKGVKVRLLIKGLHGNANDVVTLTAAEAKAAEASGEADTSKEAVAYAMTLDQNKAA